MLTHISAPQRTYGLQLVDLKCFLDFNQHNKEIYVADKYMRLLYVESAVTCPRSTMYLFRLIVLLFSSQVFAQQVMLEDVSVHLFLEKSGSLSQDVTITEEFFTHNFRPFGVGIPDEEIFHSFLIQVKFVSVSEQYILGEVATIKVVSESDKSTILKQSISGLYIGPEKIITKAFWVAEQACQNIIVTVTSPNKTITKKLPFHCGE